MGSFLLNWPRRWLRAAAREQTVPDGTQREPTSLQITGSHQHSVFIPDKPLYQGTGAVLVCWKKPQSSTQPPAKHKPREPFLSHQQRFSQHHVLQQPHRSCRHQNGTNSCSSLPPCERGRPGSELGLKVARRLKPLNPRTTSQQVPHRGSP